MEDPHKASEEKIKSFLDEYRALIEKYNVDFMSYPVFVPNERGTFEVTIQSVPVDKDQLPVKSPLIDVSSS